jgi:hypothetical protein
MRWAARLSCQCIVFFPETPPREGDAVSCTRHTVRVVEIRRVVVDPRAEVVAS